MRYRAPRLAGARTDMLRPAPAGLVGRAPDRARADAVDLEAALLENADLGGVGEVDELEVDRSINAQNARRREHAGRSAKNPQWLWTCSVRCDCSASKATPRATISTLAVAVSTQVLGGGADVDAPVGGAGARADDQQVEPVLRGQRERRAGERGEALGRLACGLVDLAAGERDRAQPGAVAVAQAGRGNRDRTPARPSIRRSADCAGLHVTGGRVPVRAEDDEVGVLALGEGTQGPRRSSRDRRRGARPRDGRATGRRARGAPRPAPELAFSAAASDSVAWRT